MFPLELLFSPAHASGSVRGLGGPRVSFLGFFLCLIGITGLPTSGAGPLRRVFSDEPCRFFWWRFAGG